MTDANEPSPFSYDLTSPPSSAETNFMALFLAEQRRIYRFIRALVPHAQDAEDVLQETATVLWREFTEYTPGTSFFAWASKVAHYRVLKHRQKWGRKASLLSDSVLEKLVALAATNDPQFDPRPAALEKCLSRLTSKDRTMIEHRYLGEKAGKDLATKLGRPANSVYKSLGRIRRSLLECVRREMIASHRLGGG